MRAIACVLVLSSSLARADALLPRAWERDRLGATVRTYESPDGREAVGVAYFPSTKPFAELVRALVAAWQPALGTLAPCGTVERGALAAACFESGLGLAHQTVRLGIVVREGRAALVVHRDRRAGSSRTPASLLSIVSSIKPAPLKASERELTPPIATAAAQAELARVAGARGGVSVRILLYPRSGGHEVPGHPRATRLDVQSHALEELPFDVQLRIGGVMASLTMVELLAFAGTTIDYAPQPGFFATRP